MKTSVPLPQTRDQEANHNETEDQHGRHDQAQKRHVTSTVACSRGGWDCHCCKGHQGNKWQWIEWCSRNCLATSLQTYNFTVNSENNDINHPSWELLTGFLLYCLLTRVYINMTNVQECFNSTWYLPFSVSLIVLPGITWTERAVVPNSPVELSTARSYSSMITLTRKPNVIKNILMSLNSWKKHIVDKVSQTCNANDSVLTTLFRITKPSVVTLT